MVVQRSLDNRSNKYYPPLFVDGFTFGIKIAIKNRFHAKSVKKKTIVAQRSTKIDFRTCDDAISNGK